MSKKIKEKCVKIKLVISDIDGVLTDGGMYYSKNGEEFKKFNTKDGMGVEILKKNGINTIFLTKENSKISEKRAKKLHCEIYLGIDNKLEKLKEICKIFKIKFQNVAYIGDDINDLSVLKSVGFSASPHDGIGEVLKVVDHVCKKNGGEGAFREFVDIIVDNKSY